ncbi:chloride channel protein [Sphingomonas sp.]|uniref:chloride channel protein n=1 Tax=Sphingomonas sp. TaxID=28214 RepID=UPI0025D9E813|nr:chloride channel protein [Sphingomonas sp.]
MPDLHIPHRALTPLAWFRRRFRVSEFWFIALAIVVGAMAGLATVGLGLAARGLQQLVFGLHGERLSLAVKLSPVELAMLPVGGLVLAGFSLLVRSRRRTFVDAVEANALHGGRMSMTDSLIIGAQNAISNGFGASVGLEAGYAQLGGAAGSVVGLALGTRRGDLRTLVGAGSGAAVAAAFGAPLAGAFYAFEIVLGAYTPAAIAPVVAASLAGALVAHLMGMPPYAIEAVNSALAVPGDHYVLYSLLGAVCAMIAIALMRTVTAVEAGTRRLGLPVWARPAVGGLLLVPMAAWSPQVLSGGHGALGSDLAITTSLSFLALILVGKSLASAITIGFGFRGGLFFASLFIGTLTGHLFAGVVAQIAGYQILPSGDAALVGMAAMAVAVIGAPLTMAMLVFETTESFLLTGAVLAASLIASTIVREGFGYSFSTWRLHLRGETIKSARDVGWVRLLTAGRMMRREVNAIAASASVAEFCRRFPLGAVSRVVLTDDGGDYAGIVAPAIVYAEGLAADATIGELARAPLSPLAPDANIVEVMETFDSVQADELAVVGPDGAVIGTLSEKFVRKRYAEELEKAQRDLFGE